MKQSLFHSLKKKLFSGELKTDVKDSFEDYLEEFFSYKSTIHQLKQLVDSQSSVIQTTMSNNQTIWTTLSSTFAESNHPCKTQLDKVAEVYLIDPLPSEVNDSLSSCQNHLQRIIDQIAGIDKMVEIRAEYLKEYTYYHSKYTKLVQKAKTQQLKGKALAKKDQDKLQRNKDKLKNIKTLLEQIDENTVHVLDQFLFIRYDLLLPVITQYLTISKKMNSYHSLYLQKFPPLSTKSKVDKKKHSIPSSSSLSTSSPGVPATASAVSPHLPSAHSSNGNDLSLNNPTSNTSYGDTTDGDCDDGSYDDDSNDTTITFHLDNIDALMAQSPSGITNHNQLLISFATVTSFDDLQGGDGSNDKGSDHTNNSPNGNVDMKTPHLFAPIEGSNYPYQQRSSGRPRRSTLVSSLDSPSVIANPKKAKRKQELLQHQSSEVDNTTSSGGAIDARRASNGSLGTNPTDDGDDDDAYLSCKAAKTPGDSNPIGFTFDDSDLESEGEEVELGYQQKYKSMKAAAEEKEREEHQRHSQTNSAITTSTTGSITSDSIPSHISVNQDTSPPSPTTRSPSTAGLQYQNRNTPDLVHATSISSSPSPINHVNSNSRTPEPPRVDNNPFDEDIPNQVNTEQPRPLTPTGAPQTLSNMSDFSFAPPPSSLGSSNHTSSFASTADSLSIEVSASNDHPNSLGGVPHHATNHSDVSLGPPGATSTTTTNSTPPPVIMRTRTGSMSGAEVIASTSSTVPADPNIRRPPPPTQRIGEGNQLQLQRLPVSRNPSQNSDVNSRRGSNPNHDPRI